MKKEFLKKCWENQRIHALMVLMIWVLSLTLLMGIVYVSSIVMNHEEKEPKIEEKKSVEEKTETTISYNEKLQRLINGEYEFTYNITKNNEKIKFEGEKQNSVIEGYKQDNSGIIKYKIENKKVYQILIDQVVEITNLYEDIDASLLDLSYVIGLLDQVEENDIITTEEELTTKHAYNLTQDEEELEIIVVENKTSIEEIRISRNNEIYQLQYQEK